MKRLERQIVVVAEDELITRHHGELIRIDCSTTRNKGNYSRKRTKSVSNGARNVNVLKVQVEDESEWIT